MICTCFRLCTRMSVGIFSYECVSSWRLKLLYVSFFKFYISFNKYIVSLNIYTWTELKTEQAWNIAKEMAKYFRGEDAKNKRK